MTLVTLVADLLKLCTNLPSASRVAVDLCECPCFSRLEDRHLILLTASYQRARTVNGRQVRPHLTEHLLSLFGCNYLLRDGIGLGTQVGRETLLQGGFMLQKELERLSLAVHSYSLFLFLEPVVFESCKLCVANASD